MGKCKLLGGGSAMGRYVWRKSEITVPEIAAKNPVINVSTKTSQFSGYDTDLVITCSELDFRTLTSKKDVYNFLYEFTGTYSTTNAVDGTVYHTCTFLFYGYMMMLNIQNSGGNSALNQYMILPSYANTSDKFVVSEHQIILPMEEYVDSAIDIFKNYLSQYSYNGTKTLQEMETSPTFFVVANNKNAYPEVGIQLGCYYELIGSIESTQALSLSTLSADTMRDIAIEEVQQEVITNVD